MTIFAEVASQWQIADNGFSALEQAAFLANDDVAFDKAGEQRKRNDQAYFLYLFTRFEDAVNRAVEVILANRVVGVQWTDRRIWEDWSRGDVREVSFLSRVRILMDKTRNDYANVQSYYNGRNKVAHGGEWTEEFFIPTIAQQMATLCSSFPMH